MVDAVNVFRRQATVLGPASQRQYVTLMSKLLKVNKRGLPQKQLAYLLWKELQGRGEALDTVSYRAGVCMGGEMLWTWCHPGQVCAWEGGGSGHGVVQGRYVGVCT